MLVQWHHGTGMGNVPTFTNSAVFLPVFHPTFPTFTSLTHPRNRSKPESHSHELPHLCAIMFLRSAFHLGKSDSGPHHFLRSRNVTKRNWRRVRKLGRPRISLHDCRFNLPARVSDPSGGEKNAGSRVVTLTVQSCEIALNRPCNCMRQILFQIMVYRKGGHEWVVNTTIFRRTATCPSRCELGESMCIVYLCVL